MKEGKRPMTDRQTAALLQAVKEIVIHLDKQTAVKSIDRIQNELTKKKAPNDHHSKENR